MIFINSFQWNRLIKNKYLQKVLELFRNDSVMYNFPIFTVKNIQNGSKEALFIFLHILQQLIFFILKIINFKFMGITKKKYLELMQHL
jgi:hypothetical protein